MLCGMLQSEREKFLERASGQICTFVYICIKSGLSMFAQDSSLRIVVPSSRHIRQLELSVVSQALFGVLDLEREGQVPQDSSTPVSVVRVINVVNAIRSSLGMTLN